MKSGDLNFLEPSGPLQACNGNALPLHNIVSKQTAVLIVIAVRRSDVIHIHVVSLSSTSVFGIDVWRARFWEVHYRDPHSDYDN